MHKPIPNKGSVVWVWLGAGLGPAEGHAHRRVLQKPQAASQVCSFVPVGEPRRDLAGLEQRLQSQAVSLLAEPGWDAGQGALPRPGH